jgi:hypothetical protein
MISPWLLIQVEVGCVRDERVRSLTEIETTAERTEVAYFVGRRGEVERRFRFRAALAADKSQVTFVRSRHPRKGTIFMIQGLICTGPTDPQILNHRRACGGATERQKE